MSGPRITAGDESAQDVATPPDFMLAIERRFGPVQFDLAAHKGNAKHARYFAPKDFVETFDPSKVARGVFVRRLMRAGAHMDEAEAAIEALGGKKGKIRVPNHDAEAAGFDAFKFLWAEISEMYGTGGNPGLLWLNPEYAAIEEWAIRCVAEAQRGASIVMLVPASVGSNWFRDQLAGRADVSLLNGRITFVGSTAGYPKDLLVAHFHPGAMGVIEVWDWRERAGAPAGITHALWGQFLRMPPLAVRTWEERRRSPEAA